MKLSCAINLDLFYCHFLRMSINPVWNFLGTICRGIGEAGVGYGALLMIQLSSNLSLAMISWMQSQGVSANEAKEGRTAQEGVGSRLAERAKRRMEDDLTDLFKAILITLVGASVLWFGASILKGESWSQNIIDVATSWGWRTKAMIDNPFMAGLAGALVTTAGSTILNLSAAKLFHIVLSLGLSGFSYVQGGTVNGAEERETTSNTGMGKVLMTRASHAVTQDLQDIAKVFATVVFGVAVVFFGACLGGDSVQIAFARRFIK